MKIAFPGMFLMPDRSVSLLTQGPGAPTVAVRPALAKDTVTLRFGATADPDADFVQLLLLDEMLAALKKGDESGVERAYREGLKPNQTFTHGKNRELLHPLHFALEWADIDEKPRLLDILLDNNEDPTIPFPDGASTLITPAFYGMPYATKRLLEAGVDPEEPDPRNGNTALIAAAEGAAAQSEYTQDTADIQHYVETMEILLAHNVATYTQNHQHETALDILKDAENQAVLKPLIDLLEVPYSF